jgi:UDP-N-acetylglucosamine/UDP-N-acetylgalactosamine diphosphorylase
MSKIISRLMEKGVSIPAPQSVEIGPEIFVNRISGKDVVIHAGCKIFGAETLILPGAILGYEAPVTINNCRIGSHVELRGGFFEEAVFLGKNQVGSGAHIRGGTIFEEEANAAHTVGLKQTILFPFVTLGSLINFCDCFMAGGTSRKDHSEVGSAYIHFNYTPNQDKATPSLLGDVSRGVMLDQPPIFLGGQGGLVGPCRIDFGNIIAAGSIFRKDVETPGNLLIGASGRGGRVPFSRHTYPNIKRIFINNIFYIANLLALMQWYRHVRFKFISEVFPLPLYEGLLNNLDIIIGERIRRLDDLISRLPASMAVLRPAPQKKEASPSANIRWHTALIENHGILIDLLNRMPESAVGDERLRDRFIRDLLPVVNANGAGYISTITALESETKEAGRTWLASIVEQVRRDIMGRLPLPMASG